MALPTIAEVKGYLGITTSADDVLLTAKLNAGLAYIQQFQKTFDDLGVTYFETELSAYYLLKFHTQCKMKDISITSVILTDAEGAQTTLTTSNYKKVGDNQWEMVDYTNTNLDPIRSITIRYTSATANYIVNEAIKEYVIYEYNRLKSGAMNNKDFSLGDASGRFVDRATFMANFTGQILEAFLMEF